MKKKVTHYAKSPRYKKRKWVQGHNVKKSKKGQRHIKKYTPGSSLYSQPLLISTKKNRSSSSPYLDDDSDDLDMQMEEYERKQKEDEKRRKYGLPELWEDESGSSQVIKEDPQKNLALIKHHDSYSPASENPDVWEIRQGDEIKWSSGTTQMGEYAHEGVGPLSVSSGLRKEAEKEFEKRVKRELT